MVKYVEEGIGITLEKAVAEMSIANASIMVYDKKRIPNRFHRFMQHVILGIKWKVY